MPVCTGICRTRLYWAVKTWTRERRWTWRVEPRRLTLPHWVHGYVFSLSLSSLFGVVLIKELFLSPPLLEHSIASSSSSSTSSSSSSVDGRIDVSMYISSSDTSSWSVELLVLLIAGVVVVVDGMGVGIVGEICERWNCSQNWFILLKKINEGLIGTALPWAFFVANWDKKDQQGWGVLFATGVFSKGMGRWMVDGSDLNRCGWWWWAADFSFLSKDVAFVSIRFRMENFNSLFVDFDMIISGRNNNNIGATGKIYSSRESVAPSFRFSQVSRTSLSATVGYVNWSIAITWPMILSSCDTRWCPSNGIATREMLTDERRKNKRKRRRREERTTCRLVVSCQWNELKRKKKKKKGATAGLSKIEKVWRERWKKDEEEGVRGRRRGKREEKRG